PLQVLCVEIAYEGVEVGQQLVRVTEEAVEVDLGEEEGQPLKILPANRVGPALVQLERVLDNVLVVTDQHIAVEFLQLPQRPNHGQKLVVVVLVQPFEVR